MSRSSKKGILIISVLILMIVSLSLALSYSMSKNVVMIKESGNKNALKEANLIFSDSADFFIENADNPQFENRNMRIRYSFLLNSSNPDILKNAKIKDNRVLYTSKNGDVYKLNNKVDILSDEKTLYFVFSNIKDGSIVKIPLKSDSSLNIALGASYRDFSLLEYKGATYLVGYSMSSNDTEKTPEYRELLLFALKLDLKNKTYTDVSERKFKIKNKIEKYDDGSIGEEERSFEFFTLSGNKFLTLDYDNDLRIFKFNPKNMKFEADIKYDKDIFPNLEYRQSYFVNYKNHLYYYYFSGEKLLVKEIVYDNGKLEPLFTERTGMETYSASKINLDKNGNITDKNGKYEVNFDFVNPKMLINKNYTIFVSNSSMTMYNKKGRYPFTPVYRIDIINLDSLTHVYSCLLKSIGGLNINNVYTSEKVENR